MPRGGVETTIGHWSTLLGGLSASPQDFYTAVEGAVGRREIPDCRLSRVDWSEGGLVSHKREYLRVAWREYVIDICGAPFGNGFFASSWLCAPPPNLQTAIVLAAAAVLGLVLLPQADLGILTWILWAVFFLAFLGVVGIGIVWPLFFPPRLTYYRIDTANMFYRAVQEAIGEVVDTYCDVQGVRRLTEAERKPVMRDYGAAGPAGRGPAAA